MHMREDYFYVNQDLNWKMRYPMRQDFEILKLLKTNWLIIGTNKPPSLSDITSTSEIKNVLIFIAQLMKIFYFWVILTQ